MNRVFIHDGGQILDAPDDFNASDASPKQRLARVQGGDHLNRAGVLLIRQLDRRRRKPIHADEQHAAQIPRGGIQADALALPRRLHMERPNHRSGDDHAGTKHKPVNQRRRPRHPLHPGEKEKHGAARHDRDGHRAANGQNIVNRKEMSHSVVNFEQQKSQNRTGNRDKSVLKCRREFMREAGRFEQGGIA